MKLNTQRKSVQSGGIALSTKMKIDMNGKAFNVLSSGIYSNIIPTVVRELSSNAYDAHIAAGTPDLPFTVGCPNVFDPHFTVKDWGTGLRYFKYSAMITNEHQGESTIYIQGDIRDQIKNIDMLVMNGDTTIDVGALLYDTKSAETVIRIAGDYEGMDIDIEFDDTLVLYSTYFRSTKEDSNDFTGAFGLGSKTPLAYTDNFLVSNRFEGTLRVYNIMTNEDNEPQISLMMSADTDEENGLEVKLAVDPNDYKDFQEAIAEQLMYFEPQPVVENEKIAFPEITYKGKDFWIVEGLGSPSGGYYDSKGHASVGNNAYEVKHIQSDLFKTGNLVLRFAIGEVMVTTSREELKYDDATNDLIRQREKDALEEYTKYVMDSIDDTGMEDYEKADFLNKNHTILNLSSEEVRKKVGNPHYAYSGNKIHIPISGWGDYTNLYREKEYTYADDGETVVSEEWGEVQQYRSSVQHALRWSTYSRSGAKSKKVSGNQWLNPTQKVIIFIRDNSFSFLKKINHYMTENQDYNQHDILILDMFSGEKSEIGFECMKSLVGHNATFVTLSSITLPKTISTTPYDRCTTPTARMYNFGDHFHGSKYWTPVYTPLTKIDTEDTYIIPSHHGNLEGMTGDQENFLHQYFNSGIAYDENITILVLGRTKYEKALGYGFKPVKKLCKKLKKTLVIPVDLINFEALSETMSDIGCSNIIDLFNSVDDSCPVKLDADSPIIKLGRIRKLFKKRYSTTETNALSNLTQYMKEKELPDVSEFVTKTIASVKDMLYSIDNNLVLLDDMSTWEVRRSEKKQAAMIKYANAIFANTGELT
jgi:hypothetical protein